MGKSAAPQSPPQTREERLAQRLRDNLRRRKAQARERDSQDQGAHAGANPALPKEPPKS